MDKQNHPEIISRDRIPDFFPGLNPRTLANYASSGKGPKYHRRGRKVYYLYEDVRNWLLEHPVYTKG